MLEKYSTFYYPSKAGTIINDIDVLINLALD